MVGKVHVVIPDPHAHPDHNNDRALWAGRLIADLKPDRVIMMGDLWDFPSLSSYDKGKKSFHGRSYQKDLEAGLDFDEKLWYTIRKNKKKMPDTTALEGNHEYRLKRALDTHYQELDGYMSFNDLELNKNYNRVVEYDGGTPGRIELDGIVYAHYFPSGVMGRPIGGMHPANALLAKGLISCTQAHIHIFDYKQVTRADGRKAHGLVAGVYQDYHTGWAGGVNALWWRGLVIKRDVEDGDYTLQQVSMAELERLYG